MFTRSWRMLRNGTRVRKMGKAVGAVMEQMEERRLLSAGTLDPTFGSGGVSRFEFPAPADAVATAGVEMGGELVVAGTAGGHIALAKYDSSGALDATFGNQGKVVLGTLDNVTVGGIATDGARLLVAGSVVAAKNQGGVRLEYQQFMVAAFNADGSVDTSFGSNGVALVDFGAGAHANAIAVDSSRIALVGQADAVDHSQVDIAVAVLDLAGSEDAAFAGGHTRLDLNPQETGTAVTFDGSDIIVAGQTTVGSAREIALARFASDGTSASSVTPVPGDGGATGVAMVGAGQIIVGGQAGQGLAATRFNSDLTVDTTFGTLGTAVATVAGHTLNAGGMAVESSGAILIAGGDLTTSTPLPVYAVISSDGLSTNVTTISDVSMGTGTAAVAGLTQDYLVGGTEDGVSEFIVAEVNGGFPGGTSVTAFDGTSPAQASASSFSPNGGPVLVAGTLSGAQNVVVVARSSAAGIADPGFGNNGVASVTVDGAGFVSVTGVLTLADGSVEVVGEVDGTNIVLINISADGQTSSVQVDAEVGNTAFGGLAQLPTGDILVGGYTPSYDAAIFAYTTAGARDTAWGTSGVATVGTGIISAIQVDATGLYVGGLNIDLNLNTTAAMAAHLDLSGAVIGGVGLTANNPGWASTTGIALTSGGIVVAGSVGTDMALAFFSNHENGGYNTGTTATYQFAYAGGTYYTGQATGVAVDDQGRIVAVGTLTYPSVDDPSTYPTQPYDIALIRCDASGALDPTFGDGGQVLSNLGSITESGDTAAGVSFNAGQILVAGATSGSLMLAAYTSDDSAPTSAPPAVTPLQDQSANEGAPVSFSGQFTDDAPAGATFLWHVESSNGQAIPDATTQDFSFTPNDNGTYTVTFTVTDAGGLSDTTSATVTVSNVAPAPVIDPQGPTSGVSGQNLQYTGSATDAGTADTLTLGWVVTNQSNQVVATGSGNSFSFTPSAADTYTVTLTATDDDGGSNAVTLSVTVTAPPVQVINGTMIVNGSAGVDDIDIRMTQTGQIKVLFGGVSAGLFSGVNHIVVYGGDGDDDIKLNPGLNASAVVYGGNGNDKLVTGAGGDALFGGAGDDTLKGRDGADILVGGSGNDLLSGGDGNDLLIGGLGEDRIIGNSNDDILVAGTTSYDNDLPSLQLVLNEWNSGRLYYTRVLNIMYGTGSLNRLNGNVFLRPDVTVFDDGARDVLSGDQGTDWFLFNADSGVADKVTDLSFWEVPSDLDVLSSMG